MGHDNRQHGSAGTVLAIVAVIAVLLLGGLMLLGVGAWFFVRTEAEQAEVVAVRQFDQAVAEMEKYEELTAQVEIEELAKAAEPEATAREFTVELDRDGSISVDEEPTDLDGLKTRIQGAAQNGSVRLTVQLEADPRCLAQHVIAVQSLCREFGIEDVHMSVSETPPSAAAVEDASTSEAAELP